MDRKADLLINVFGKPWQTLLSIFSLLHYSDRSIDRIFLTFEPVEIVDNEGEDYREIIKLYIKKYLSNRVSIYTPKYWFRSDIPYDINLKDDARYRHSVRYQYGWERSKADYLFIIHNDVLFTGDILPYLFNNIGDHLGAGSVGQCWNCPLNWERICDPSKYSDIKLNYEQLRRIYWESIPPEGLVKRPYHSPDFNQTIIDKPWPTPECRVNEWGVLLNLKVAREITQPKGDVIPFGAKWGEVTVFDTGVQWFREVSNLGYSFKDLDIYKYLVHEAGKPVMNDKDLYLRKEMEAKNILENRFGVV